MAKNEISMDCIADGEKIRKSDLLTKICRKKKLYFSVEMKSKKPLDEKERICEEIVCRIERLMEETDE